MMRKLSQINEGFLSKTLNRAKTGEERNEDKLPQNNIKNLKEVDLGFPIVFANRDLIIGDKTDFTWFEFEEYRKSIENTGWRLPGWDEIIQYFLKSKYSPEELRDDISINYTYDQFEGTHLVITRKSFKDELDIVIFNDCSQSYWSDWSYAYDCPNTGDKNLDTGTRETARMYRFANPNYAYRNKNSCQVLTKGNAEKTNKLRIRLVKDKK
ncbi:MAG: hypothetical protein NC548_21370 [Lachnospiraceae bacterium]|nr:hypothetical protein [Lachnospiraceae bacterium]